MKRILALLLVAVMVLGLTAIPAKAEAEEARYFDLFCERVRSMEEDGEGAVDRD